MITILGMIGSIVMPFFNIPLIMRIRKRKSSEDISTVWTLGIFSCALLMLPSALVSGDVIFKVFGIINTLLFGGVVYHVLKFKR